MVCMVYGLYSMLEFKLSCEIFLLLNMVDVDRWKAVELLLNVCAAQDNCSSSI